MNKRARFLVCSGFEPVDRVPRRAGYVQGMRETMTKYLGKDPDEYFDMDVG